MTGRIEFFRKLLIAISGGAGLFFFLYLLQHLTGTLSESLQVDLLRGRLKQEPHVRRVIHGNVDRTFTAHYG